MTGGVGTWWRSLGEGGTPLVVVSAPCRRDAWFPEVLAGMDVPASRLAVLPGRTRYDICSAPEPATVAEASLTG